MTVQMYECCDHCHNCGMHHPYPCENPNCKVGTKPIKEKS